MATKRHCPRCDKTRLDDSPRSYVWWHVRGLGLMCWACYRRLHA